LRKPIIGLLANIYEAGTGIRAGGHLHFIEVVKRWIDVDLVVFAPEMARCDFTAALPQARFVAMPALPPSASKAVDFLYRSLAAVVRFRELRRCDALLATSHLLADITPLVISGKPVAVIAHHLIGAELGRDARTSSIPMLGERLSFWATRLCDVRAFITSSKLVARELRAIGLKAPIVVSTNGVEHSLDAHPVDISGALRDGAVYVGRLHPVKNIDDAIRAWRLVVDRFPRARLTIIGAPDTPAYLAELEKLIVVSKLEGNVTLVGLVDEEAKADALARAKVFLFPSGEEGWGIALAEAMRAGLPCVTYDLPIFEEIFPIGRLEAPLGDFTTLAMRVIELLADEPARLRHAADALKLAETFSWERASHIAAEVFQEMLQRKSIRRGNRHA
jgi:glycosyltransferase involved in cell wall biosynthesis